jgi:hypothetical protein
MSPLQDRFPTEPLPLQLGAIAANLSRIQSFSDHPGHMKIVERMIAETIGFVGFLLSNPKPDLPAELAELREWLTSQAGEWGSISRNPDAVALLAAKAGEWSDRVLRRSGLLNVD